MAKASINKLCLGEKAGHVQMPHGSEVSSEILYVVTHAKFWFQVRDLPTFQINGDVC